MANPGLNFLWLTPYSKTIALDISSSLEFYNAKNKIHYRPTHLSQDTFALHNDLRRQLNIFV